MAAAKPKLSFLVTVATPLIVAAVVAVFSVTQVLYPLDGFSYNTLMRFSRPPVERELIAFVDVDDRAVDIAGTWPLRRDIVADAVVLMAELGLDYLVFDIEYVDRSPTVADERVLDSILPERTLSLLGTTERSVTSFLQAVRDGRVATQSIDLFLDDVSRSFLDTTQGLKDLYAEVARDADDYLGRAIGLLGNGFVTVNLAPGVQFAVSPELQQYYSENIALHNVSGAIETLPDDGAILPTIGPIARRAAGAGYPNVVIDPDGVRRRLHLMQRFGDDIYGQLTFVPLLQILGNPEVIVEPRAIVLQGAQHPDHEEPIDIRIPRSGDGTMLLNWPHGDYFDTFDHISFGAMIDHNNLVQSFIRNIQIRQDFGYLDDFRAADTASAIAVGLLETRRDAIFSGNRQVLQRYSEDLEEFLNQMQEFLSREQEARFFARIGGQRDSGRITREEAEFLMNDYPLWVDSVRGQIEDIKSLRTSLREELAGRVGIIGNAATGTTDIGVTPFSGTYINIGTHAAVMNTILNGDFLIDLPWWVASVFALVLNLALVFMIRSTGPVVSGIIDLVLALVGLATSVLLFRVGGIFLSPVPTLIGNGVIYAVFTIVKFRQAEAEKGFIKDAFSHYLSEDVISDVLNDPSKLALGGEQRYITAMFTDVKGFSTISEQLTPEELVLLLNRYLSAMSDIVLDEKGTIDKYEGDAIIAFFGAPIYLADHAPRACRSAVRMRKVEQELNKEFLAEKMTPTPLLTRIGVNSGDMVVGNMGTERKMNYTMMGNAVNLAARLEGVNKQYGTWVLTSEETRGLLGDDFVLRKLDRVRVVGINTPVRLFDVMDIVGEAPKDIIERAGMFEKGIDAYEGRKFDEAIKIFEECLKAEPEDGPAEKFLALAQGYRDAPPPEDWDAVVNLTSK